VHCIGGIVGALLTGALVSKEISGVDGGADCSSRAWAATLIYGFVMSMIILKLIDLTIGLRVTADEEREGLDISQHGESIE
jgi:Amt family ammonium transporter